MVARIPNQWGLHLTPSLHTEQRVQWSKQSIAPGLFLEMKVRRSFAKTAHPLWRPDTEHKTALPMTRFREFGSEFCTEIIWGLIAFRIPTLVLALLLTRGFKKFLGSEGIFLEFLHASSAVDHDWGSPRCKIRQRLFHCRFDGDRFNLFYVSPSLFHLHLGSWDVSTLEVTTATTSRTCAMYSVV